MEEEEIRGLLREGYRPYKRSYGDGYNISLRKGNNERTVGAYTEYAWNWIRDELESLKLAERNRVENERVIATLAQRRAMAMVRDCMYIEDRYCTYWSFDVGDRERLGRLSPREAPGDPESIQVVANIMTCMNCPGYQPRLPA